MCSTRPTTLEVSVPSLLPPQTPCWRCRDLDQDISNWWVDGDHKDDQLFIWWWSWWKWWGKEWILIFVCHKWASFTRLVRTWTRWMNDEETHKADMANTYKAFFDDDFDDREKDDIFKIKTNKCQGGPGNNRRRSTLHCRPRFCSCLYHAQHTGWDLEFLDNVDYHPHHCYHHHLCKRN